MFPFVMSTISSTTNRMFPLTKFFNLDPSQDINEYKDYYLCNGAIPSTERCCSCERSSCLKFRSCCVDALWDNSTIKESLNTYFQRFLNENENHDVGYQCTDLLSAHWLPKSSSGSTSTSALYYMINKCRKMLPLEPLAHIKKCETEDKTIRHIPVISSNGSAIYRNVYCAKCNGEYNSTVLQIRGDCKNEFNKQSPDLAYCHFKLKDRDISDIFKCFRTSYDSRKDAKCSSKSLQRACQSYLGVVGFDTRFPNYHCQKCSGKEWSRQDLLKYDKCFILPKTIISWSIFIDYSGTIQYRNRGNMYYDQKCENDQSYDIFTKKCSSNWEEIGFPPESSLIEIQSNIALYGTSISIFANMLVMAIYCSFKDLKNIHGLNIVAMCISLTLSDVLFLILSTVPDESKDTICYPVLMSLGWFMLNSQMWVLIICFDLGMVIHLKTSATFKNKRKTLTRYVMVTFLVPSVIIGIALSLNETDSIALGYETSCNLQHFMARLWMTVLPMIVLIMLSIGILVKTMIHIYSEKKDTAQRFNSNQYDVNVVGIAVKLVIGLGLIEIVGFIQIKDGSKTFNEINLCVYNIARSLRGLFVFVIFVCNKKVIQLLKNKMFQSPQTSKSTTDET